jgi:N utilization substance protein A
MDEETAYRLAEVGIVTCENLADLATDELLEKVTMDEANASSLIMAARAQQYA